MDNVNKTDGVRVLHTSNPPCKRWDGRGRGRGRGWGWEMEWFKKNILIRLEKYLFLVFYLFKFVLNFKL